MPEGNFCKRAPISTDEELKHLLSDKGGTQYYKEMEDLEVDQDKLWKDLQKTCKSRTRTWLDICAHCGMCAKSCFLYTANGNDPKQIPSHKIQHTLGEMIRRKGKVDTKFMMHAMDVAWSQCTCCNRCSLYCPHGIDTGVMNSYMRGILFQHGYTPWEMKIGSGMHRVYHAQMDVSEDEFVETCEWRVEENEDIWPDLEIPVEKENADVMYILNAREAKHYPEDIDEAAILFHIAGENWTVPREGWENTSLAMFAGDWEACKDNVKRVYDAVERLKPKVVVGTECGHAHRATVIEGPYWAGREDGSTPTRFMHYVEWVAEALRTGKLKIDPAKRLKQKVTLQDACNYVRSSGLSQYTREIMSYIADDFVEMSSPGDHNYCCGGGGGFNGIGKYRAQRNIALKPKLDQINATGASYVIAPCHNCWDAIRDMKEVYEEDAHSLEWSFLKPLILSMVVIPDHIKHNPE